MSADSPLTEEQIEEGLAKCSNLGRRAEDLIADLLDDQKPRLSSDWVDAALVARDLLIDLVALLPLLPRALAELRSRRALPVIATCGGCPFIADTAPDGEGPHWQCLNQDGPEDAIDDTGAPPPSWCPLRKDSAHHG